MGSNFSPQVLEMVAGSSTFGGRIASLLEKKNMSQSELARAIKKSPQAVQKWVNGGLARGKTIEALARALNTTEAYLLAGDAATMIVAKDQNKDSYLLIPLVKWSDISMDIKEMIEGDLVIGRVPAIAGVHSEDTVCTVIEEGGAWMDERINDGTMVFVQKNIDVSDLKSGQLVIANFGGRIAPRMLMLDGSKRILVTTNPSVPQQTHEMQEGDKIEGLIVGAYTPFY